MSDPAYALQVAVAAALLADDAITALVGDRVRSPLDAVGVAYPFIEIGDDQVLGEANGCFEPSEIYANVHVWAAGPAGQLVAKQIANAVRPVLSQPLTLDGHTMISARFDHSRPMTEGDRTDPELMLAHLVLTFHYRTLPAA